VRVDDVVGNICQPLGLGTQHLELFAQRDSALNAVLGASLSAVRAHEASPHEALAHALKDLPAAAVSQLDAFVPDFSTRGPQVLASAPALADACFPRVQSGMLRTLHDAVAHAEAAMEDQSAAGASVAADDSPTSSSPRRLLGGAAPRRASAAATGWSDGIVRPAPARSTPSDALAAALSRDASSVAAALGAGSGAVALDSIAGVSATTAAAAVAAATVDPCRGARAVAAVACAAANGTTAFWIEETRAPGAVAMCGHAINTLSTLACADVAAAESCAAAATASLPCSAPCTASLGALRSACDALVPRSQHGRFIERSAASDRCRDAVMAAHDTCSASSPATAAAGGSCAALLEAMPESLSRVFKTAFGASHYPAWWEELDAWGLITPGLGANHFHAIHLSRNKLMGRVPKSMWSELHPEATAVIISDNLLVGDVPGPLAPHVQRVLATRNRLSGDLGDAFGAAVASGSLTTLHVAHNRFSAPDGLAAFARLGARSLEQLHINHNDFAPSAEASRQLPAHIASMANLRQYSLAGNHWAYEEVAEGAKAASAAAAAAAALGGAHDIYPASLGSATVDVQLTFPGLTSAWFCALCAALSGLEGAFLSESTRHTCVHNLGSDSEQTCGDKELFAAARCVLQGLLPKRIIAEAGATVSGVSVYEVADTAAGHASDQPGCLRIEFQCTCTHWPHPPHPGPVHSSPDCSLVVHLSDPSKRRGTPRSACGCPSARPPLLPPSRRRCVGTIPTARPSRCPLRASPPPAQAAAPWRRQTWPPRYPRARRGLMQYNHARRRVALNLPSCIERVTGMRHIFSDHARHRVDHHLLCTPPAFSV
jgi:hypothetical protein